jgi:peptidylprolyl isomerase
MIVKLGSSVSVEYEGRFENGEIFDSSRHGDHSHPMTFEVGKKQVIEGFEKAVIGMKEGEEKIFSVEPKEGYGLPDERFFREIPRKSLPLKPELAPGMSLAINTPEGEQIPVSIVKVENDIVTLDFNHPLAGRKLIFKIKVIGIDKEPPVHHH